MTLLEKIEQNKEDLLNIRHQIHRHPETARVTVNLVTNV